jgi:hypothetical protein
VHIPDPISLTVDGQGVTTAATIDLSLVRRWRQSNTTSEQQDNDADDAARAAAATE